MGLLDGFTNGTQGYGGLLDFLQNMGGLQPVAPSNGFSEQPRYSGARSAYDPTPPALSAFTNGTQGYGGVVDFLQNMGMQPAQSTGFNEQPRYNAAQSAYEPPEQSRFNPAQSAYDAPASATIATPAPRVPLPMQRPADAPSGYMQIGDYSMPQFGPRELYQPQQQAQLPPNAQPTQGQAPQVAAQPQPQDQLTGTPPAFLQPPSPGGFGGAMRGFLANAHTGPLGAIFGAMGGAAGMGQGNPQDVARQNLKAQYDALVPMLGQQKAMLAVMNPEAGKTLISEALTNKEKWQQTGEDSFGNKQYGFVNEREQTINGRPMSAGGGQQDGGGMLAPGVKQIDSNLSGAEYLKQFSPEVQAAVNDYIAGKSMPTGNPRKGFTQAVKMVAQKYGADIGQPADDTNFAERRKYRTELATNSPNAAGGQAKAFNQGIDHLSHLATTLEKLDNSNGLGIPFVAQGVNAVRQGASNEQSAIADEAKSLGQTVAGEVGKLFSGSAGGGVHERELTRERFSTVKSRPQLAAALQATIETMQGGLHALEQRRDSILGPNSGVELVAKATTDKIAQIQIVIDRLKGSPSTTIAPDRSAVEAEMRRRGLLK